MVYHSIYHELASLYLLEDLRRCGSVHNVYIENLFENDVFAAIQVQNNTRIPNASRLRATCRLTIQFSRV